MAENKLSDLPKVVLHEHIEGSITPEVAKYLAKKYRTSVPAHFFDASQSRFYFDKNDFTSFLEIYDFIASLVRDEEDYYTITKDYLKRNAELGLCYCELISSPLHMAGSSDGEIDRERYKRCLLSIRKAIDEMHRQHGLITRLHAVGIRHLGLSHIASIIELLHDCPDDLVVGFNIAGDERQGKFSDMSVLAAKSSLQKSFHAGEICSAASVVQALEAGARRIGHGVAAIEDEALMQRLIDQEVILEVSISSNLLLLEKYRNEPHQHPVKKLYDAGVRINLNTDDAGIFNTDIQQEYKLAQDCYGFQNYELLDISLCAVEAAFIEQDEKIKLMQRIYDCFDAADLKQLSHDLFARSDRLALNQRLKRRRVAVEKAGNPAS